MVPYDIGDHLRAKFSILSQFNVITDARKENICQFVCVPYLTSIFFLNTFLLIDPPVETGYCIEKTLA